MQRPLQEHIAHLEKKIVILKQEIRNNHLPPYQRTQLELDLANAEDALKQFRKAVALEQNISN